MTTAALALAVWPALVRPEPPLEKAGGDGLRIRVIETPKAAAADSSRLDVGLSQAVQAMTQGREALFIRTPPPPIAPPPARPRPSPAQVAQAEDEADFAPPPDPVDDRWEREAWRRDRFEEAQRRRWEDERLAREARDDRAGWMRDRRDRERWESDREQDRYDGRHDLPPPPEPEDASPER